MTINLNQYRGTVGMFNNCKNIYCNSCNIYYNKALRIYSSFIFFRVIFICVAYLFSLTVCLMSSSSMLLRAKFQISYTYLNTILYFSITCQSFLALQYFYETLWWCWRKPRTKTYLKTNFLHLPLKFEQYFCA